MGKIEKENHKELIKMLKDLIEVINIMKTESSDYLITQNGDEAKDWLDFLENHFDKDELKSLENEISDRFFYKFDVQIGKSELDNKRAKLMKDYIFKSNDFLK